MGDMVGEALRGAHLLAILATTACSTSEVKFMWGSAVSKPHRQRSATRLSAGLPGFPGPGRLLAMPMTCFTNACEAT